MTASARRLPAAALWQRWRTRLRRLERERADEHVAELTLVRAVLVRAAVPGLGPVAAVRRAAGEDPVACRQALEYLWHVLGGEPDGPVRWNVSPAVHAIHLHDLARWEERAEGRDAAELRGTALERVDADIARLAAERPEPV